MNINKNYQNVDPELIHSELEAAVKMHGGQVDGKSTYARKLTGGAFTGEIHATFAEEVIRTRKKGMFATEKVTEQEWHAAFSSRVVGQIDNCKLRIQADEEVIGMGTITAIEVDLNSIVGIWEVTEA